jgi:hypothetical protein
MVGLKLLGFYGLMNSQVRAKRHHCKNGRRRSPSPTYLDSVRSNGTDKYKKARRDPSKVCSGSLNPQSQGDGTKDTTDGSTQNQPKRQMGRWSINPKGTEQPKPTTLTFYPPFWQKVLDFAKAQMQLNVMVENTFPALDPAIRGPCSECLLEALAYNKDNNLELEAGKSYAFHCLACSYLIDIWPNHKANMARLVSQVHK